MKDASDYLVAAKPQFVIPAKAKPKVLATLSAIRALFGPRGQYWITGEEHEVITEDDDGNDLARQIDKFCLVGAAKEVNGDYEGAARAAISLAILEREETDDDAEFVVKALDDDQTITSFNDASSWKDVQAVLARSRKIVQRAAEKV